MKNLYISHQVHQIYESRKRRKMYLLRLGERKEEFLMAKKYYVNSRCYKACGDCIEVEKKPVIQITHRKNTKQKGGTDGEDL